MEGADHVLVIVRRGEVTGVARAHFFTADVHGYVHLGVELRLVRG